MKIRLKELEQQDEKREKERKRRNFVLTGVVPKEVNLNEEIKTFIKTNLEKDVEIENSYIIKSEKYSRIIVQVKTEEQKAAIFASKNKLRGKNIYIDQDLTWRQRQIQKKNST